METNIYSISTFMCVLSGIWFFVTSGTVAWQAPLSLPLLPSGDLHNPGIKPVSPALAGRFFTAEPLGKPYSNLQLTLNSTFYIKKKNPAFYFIAEEKATWVTSSSTGAIQENSARVLALAGSAQTSTVWSGNTALICAASVSTSMRRTSA